MLDELRRLRNIIYLTKRAFHYLSTFSPKFDERTRAIRDVVRRLLYARTSHDASSMDVLPHLSRHAERHVQEIRDTRVSHRGRSVEILIKGKKRNRVASMWRVCGDWFLDRQRTMKMGIHGASVTAGYKRWLTLCRSSVNSSYQVSH